VSGFSRTDFPEASYGNSNRHSFTGEDDLSDPHREQPSAERQFFEGLGFGVGERWEENGTLLGVMLRAGEARIGLSQDDWKKGRDRQKGAGMRIYVGTKQNIDQLATRPSTRESRWTRSQRTPRSLKTWCSLFS
jgi:hypothetical protein